MDRRRLKSRSSALHKDLRSSDNSQASVRSEDPPTASTSRWPVTRSQRFSNSEILRRQTRSASSVLQSSSGVDVPEKTKESCEGSSNLDDASRKGVSSSNKRPSPEQSSSILAKRKKISSNLTENDEPASTTDEPAHEKLLKKRKKCLPNPLDSDSESEHSEKSSLKVRHIDSRQYAGTLKASASALEPSKAPIATDVRSTQLGTSILSSCGPRPLRLTQSQRESNSSRLKQLATPVKIQESALLEEPEELLSPLKRRSGNKLEDFLKRSGITVAQDDESYQLNDDPPTVEKKMANLLSSGKFQKQEIVDLWRVFVNDEDNLKKALNDVSVVSDKLSSHAGNKVSLVRIFLQVPDLQTQVLDYLLQNLNEKVLLADSIDDVPWFPLLLQQFRFLETVVDTDTLTIRLEELLETCPVWFQRELILFLPDMVVDVQHHAIAEMLSKLMESHADLTNVVLECIANLTLGKEYLEELRDKILSMLKSNLDVGRTPAMAKFVLNECPTLEVCQKTLVALRSLELQPLSGEKNDEYFTNQSFVTSALKMNILVSKNMSAAAIAVVKKTTDPPKPLDLIMLLLVYSEMSKRKIAENVLKQHVKTGFYRPSLLTTFYQDYKEVARDLQCEALQLASNLLKSEGSAYSDFAIEWFRHQFLSQSAAIYRQREVIEKIILLMGNNDHTAKRALEVLRRLTENEEEKKYLHAHCNHLRILLEKIDNFDLQEVATLSDLLYALCTCSNSASEALKDDLFILLQKQLSNSKTLTKCKGVLSAAMAIKHLAGNPETCQIAEEIFAKVEIGMKNCPRSQALFYDQIGRVIADTTNIDTVFLKDITEKFQDDFVNTYMTDLNDYKGELVPKYGLIDVESEPQKCVINFGDGKHGTVVPAFFRLLRVCFMRLNDGDLTDINLLLGVPVLMPSDTDAPEPQCLDLVICCINWFRELVSGFVDQPDEILREQILKRVADIMTLQAEFSTMLKLGDARYQPPMCYFHRFPAPPFVKVEKKVVKKGKRRASLDKTSSLPEWEAWEMGSTLCAKNPTYFRQMDAKVINLLDVRMDQQVTQSPRNISKAQVCFLIKEFLAMVDGGDASESLTRDLVHLLPKICSKLGDVVAELREKDDTKNRLAAKLMLSLLTMIFDWKGFNSAKYHSLLRDGLRTLAGQIQKSNSMLRSSKELVAESYKYFESLSDVATEISLAFAVIKMCRTLMKHSETFVQQCKNKQAKLAYGFLSLQWPDDNSAGAAYKAAVVGLLANWIQNEPDPLETVTSVLEWLPEEVATLEKPRDRLERLPSITKACFHHMFRRLFEGLISGAKISFAEATSDPKRIQVWRKVGHNVSKIIQICKSSSRAILPPFLRYNTILLKLFMRTAMPILEQSLRYQTEEVKEILKKIQGATRYLNMVCVDSAEKKDLALAKLVPAAKQVTERMLYLVKGMLVLNNSPDAFWMGNLVNKNLEGQEILSQCSDDVTSESVGDSAAIDSADEDISAVLQDEDVEDEVSDDEFVRRSSFYNRDEHSFNEKMMCFTSVGNKNCKALFSATTNLSGKILEVLAAFDKSAVTTSHLLPKKSTAMENNPSGRFSYLSYLQQSERDRRHVTHHLNKRLKHFGKITIIICCVLLISVTTTI